MPKFAIRQSVRPKAGGDVVTVCKIEVQEDGSVIYGVKWTDQWDNPHIASATEDDLEAIEDKAGKRKA